MIDKIDIEKQAVKPEQKKIKPVAKTKDKKRGLFFLLFVLLLPLYVGAYWFWQQQQSVNSRLLELAVPAPKFDASMLEQSIAEVKKQATSLNDGLESLAKSVQILNEKDVRTGGDVDYYWVMTEVKSLLNIANQRALLANDTQSAIEALGLADRRIKALSDYRLHPLRALLADDILALSSVNKVDVVGLNLQLQSALSRVDALDVLMSRPVNLETEKNKAQTPQPVMDTIWQEVKSLVVIRHQDEGAAVLVPEQRYFLYQNLNLKLEAARLALLAGNQAVFDASVQAISDWLTVYFVGDERDAMLDLMANLSEQKIEVILPDISASLRWLREFEQ